MLWIERCDWLSLRHWGNAQINNTLSLTLQFVSSFANSDTAATNIPSLGEFLSIACLLNAIFTYKAVHNYEKASCETADVAQLTECLSSLQEAPELISSIV